MPTPSPLRYSTGWRSGCVGSLFTGEVQRMLVKGLVFLESVAASFGLAWIDFCCLLLRGQAI